MERKEAIHSAYRMTGGNNFYDGMTTCVDGCRCDYTICGDKDPYLKEHPEYRDEAGFRRNK